MVCSLFLFPKKHMCDSNIFLECFFLIPLYVYFVVKKGTQGYQLKQLFNEHGEVQKIFMPKEKVTGKGKGIAFVTMASQEERDLSIEKLNGIELDGRTIYVDKAKPRSEKQEDSKG